MPDAINRSSASQISSYGPPPEPLVSAAAAPPSAAPAPPHVDLGAASSPLERPEKAPLSYEKCIAQYERAGASEGRLKGIAGGCLAGAAAGFGKTWPVMLGGCIALGVGGALAGASSGTSTGKSEGAIACDDLPKKP